MKNVILKGIIACVLFSIFLAGFFYFEHIYKLNCEEENQYCSSINKKILEFDESIFSMIDDLEKTATDLENLYVKQDEILKKMDFNRNQYYTNESGIFMKTFSSEKSSVFVSGFNELTEDIKNIVYFTEPIEESFAEFIEKNSIVSQIYYNEKHSYNRTYPAVKIDGIIDAKIDLRKYLFFRSADENNNPTRDIVILNKPYLDPAGAGWIISILRPIYFNDELQGVLGTDITLNNLRKNLCLHDRMVVVNEYGDIIVASGELYNFFGIDKNASESYYAPVNKDVFLPEIYNLKHNKNIFSREIWDRVDEGNTEGEISILDKEIHYCLRKIDSLNLKHIHLYY